MTHWSFKQFLISQNMIRVYITRQVNSTLIPQRPFVHKTPFNTGCWRHHKYAYVYVSSAMWWAAALVSLRFSLFQSSVITDESALWGSEGSSVAARSCTNALYWHCLYDNKGKDKTVCGWGRKPWNDLYERDINKTEALYLTLKTEHVDKETSWIMNATMLSDM